MTDDLSDVEIKALQDAANGFTTSASAERSFKSPETIKSHRSAAIRKLGAFNIAHAVAVGIRKAVIR